jgi:hypothetical protein
MPCFRMQCFWHLFVCILHEWLVGKGLKIDMISGDTREIEIKNEKKNLNNLGHVKASKYFALHCSIL